MSSLITSDHNLMYVHEIAAMFRISKMSVYRLIQTGELRAMRVGQRGYRIRREDLERYVADNTSDATPVA